MNNAIKREQSSLFELPSVSILREAKRILLILFTLLPVSMMGQNEKTSRLEVWNRISLTNKGIDYYEKLINTFKYGGNHAAELWYETDKDAYNNKIIALINESQRAQQEFKAQGDTARANSIREQYYAQIAEVERKEDYFDSLYTQYPLLFIEGPSFYAESALTYKITKSSYEEKDGESNIRVVNGELIAMKSDENIWYTIEQPPVIRTARMEVDGVLLDSLLHLTAYACYTSANRDSHHMVMDGTSCYFFWERMQSKVSDDADGMQKLLAQTFSNVTKAVLDNDKEKLKSLAPTINRLLAHYRSLQLPDQYIRKNIYSSF